ncbi:hypothetical protein [Roseinatronobacter alkalisoli]|uniref:Response regulator n=1 Tax=Roseinatronobacter alkalisoli TaxID=3028235 RepID=A0ABT5TBG0_9RHOB|nr:hypothetical protein [Roseinatronobacter sp. HJB301]MDD7972458.1 hypothetical protein [Roseinatronobacter sp. HJB301]
MYDYGNDMSIPPIPRFDGVAVAFMAFSDETQDMQNWVYDILRVNIMAVSYSDRALEWLKSSAMKLDFVIVDVEHLGGVHQALNFCLAIRAALPDLKIILISDEVAGDDFGSERKPVCDGTLMKPISQTRLLDAVLICSQNQRSRAVMEYA